MIYQCKICRKDCKFHYGKKNLYCSVVCQQADRRNNKIQDWLKGAKWKLGVPAWVKDKDGYLARRDGYECQECGISKHNKKEIILECDHIDGDHLNNKPNNLRLICPNCHSQTTTYKNRNMGKGRSHRKQHN